MPRRRRVPKRRTDPQAEACAWAAVFESGYDFFGDLDAIGLVDPAVARLGDSDLVVAKAEFRTAAEDAWRRHGRAFMAVWAPKAARENPWALQEFGRP